MPPKTTDVYLLHKPRMPAPAPGLAPICRQESQVYARAHQNRGSVRSEKPAEAPQARFTCAAPPVNIFDQDEFESGSTILPRRCRTTFRPCRSDTSGRLTPRFKWRSAALQSESDLPARSRGGSGNFVSANAA